MFTALFPVPKTVPGTEWVLKKLLLSEWVKWKKKKKTVPLQRYAKEV